MSTSPWPIQYGAYAGSTTPSLYAENTYEVRDMVTHTWGSHEIRVGAEVRFEQDNDNLLGDQRPTYAMQGLWTMANDAAIYEAIEANPLTGGTPITQRYFRSDDIAGYAARLEGNTQSDSQYGSALGIFPHAAAQQGLNDQLSGARLRNRPATQRHHAAIAQPPLECTAA